MNSATMSGISLLNFDETLKSQPLLRGYPMEWIDFSDLRGCNGYCSADALRIIRERLGARRFRRVTLIGNGNYHYVTYVLLSEIRQPFSLILFDHHTDLEQGGDLPYLSCGSWVSIALRTLPQLDRVVIIGAQSSDERSHASVLPSKVTVISEQEVSRLSTVQVVRALRRVLPDQPVYISIDKDVLDRDHAVTNWDQGSMTLSQLLDVIRELMRTRQLAGVDVCGELPLTPIDYLSDERVRSLKKNEIANKAIVDALLAG